MECVTEFKKIKKMNPEDSLSYEFSMLKEAYCRANKSKKENDKDGEGLYLEAFLLHAVNLIDFLKGNEHKDRNGNVQSLNIKNCKNRKGEFMEVLELNFDSNFIKKIHSHCRHLGKSRLEYKYDWKTESILAEISRGVEEFYKIKRDKNLQK